MQSMKEICARELAINNFLFFSLIFIDLMNELKDCVNLSAVDEVRKLVK